MSPRFYRIIVALTVAGIIGFFLAILFLGYSSTAGGIPLKYDGYEIPTEAQYTSDQHFIVDFLVQQGFRERPERSIVDKSSRGNKPPEGYIYVSTYEHSIWFSRPVSIELYRDATRSGFWLFLHARNPTWAVPKMRAVLQTLRLPLWRAWHNHCKTQNG